MKKNRRLKHKRFVSTVTISKEVGGGLADVVHENLRERHDDMMDALMYSLFMQQNYVWRRVTWQDVLQDYGIATVALKHTGKFAWNVVLTLKDFILGRSKSFYTSSVTGGNNVGNRS